MTNVVDHRIYKLRDVVDAFAKSCMIYPVGCGHIDIDSSVCVTGVYGNLVMTVVEGYVAETRLDSRTTLITTCPLNHESFKLFAVRIPNF